MRRLSRFDFYRATFEGGVVCIVLMLVCAFCFSPLMEWVGEKRAAITADNVALAIVTVLVTAIVAFVSGLATRAFKMGYKIQGSSLAEVSSYQPALWVAVKTARKMEKRGFDSVRIFEPSGTEVPRSEWDAAH